MIGTFFNIILNNAAPISRSLMRYVVGMMVGYGLIGEYTGEYLVVDPDIALIAASVLFSVVEGLYATAKKKGWAT